MEVRNASVFRKEAAGFKGIAHAQRTLLPEGLVSMPDRWAETQATGCRLEAKGEVRQDYLAKTGATASRTTKWRMVYPGWPESFYPTAWPLNGTKTGRTSCARVPSRAWWSTIAGCPEPRRKSWTSPANTAGMSGCTTLALRTRPGRLSSGAQRLGAVGTRGHGAGAS